MNTLSTTRKSRMPRAHSNFDKNKSFQDTRAARNFRMRYD